MTTSPSHQRVKWHEIKASECLPSLVDSAKANRQRRGHGR